MSKRSTVMGVHQGRPSVHESLESRIRRGTMLVLGLMVSALVLPVQADDTDVYLDPVVPTASKPRIMLSIDYRSNLGSTVCANTLISCPEYDYFNDQEATKNDYDSLLGRKLTFFDVLRGSLKIVISELDDVFLGLMMNHDNRNNCEGPNASGCSNGGYILRGFEELQTNDINNSKNGLYNKLESVPTPSGNLSHSYQGKELFFELFRYLTGQGIYNAHNGWTDYGTSSTRNLDDDNSNASWDTRIENGGNYISPLSAATECTRFYTVNFMFQVANQEDDSDAAILASKAEGGMAGINLSGNNNRFETVLAYLNDVDLGDGTFGTVPDLEGQQNVTSYFLIDSNHINNTTNSYAEAGGTIQALELSEDPEELVDQLRSIFNQILSVSTTFVAASVPVNVFNRAQIIDNVYIALFQPDENNKAQWPGNLKKLRLKTQVLPDGSRAVFVADSLDSLAVATDGRIRSEALTYWTDPSLLLPAPPPSPDQEVIIDGRDGRTVERGGAGQLIPGARPDNESPGSANSQTGARQIYFDQGPGALLPLNDTLGNASTLAPAFGTTDARARELIRFMRGQDTRDADGDNNLTEGRPWIMGDVLHSRPLPINYGAIGGYSTDNQGIFIAVASNDGLLRYFRNTDEGASVVESGEEVWAYAPTEIMGIQDELETNAQRADHLYGFDGAPVAYARDVDRDGTIESADGDKVYLYAGLRRGGKVLYALDVTNPELPSLLWKISDQTTGFSELGYTFSQPRVAELNWGSGVKPVLVFAGGYDMNKDLRTGVGTDDSIGNAIYIVDAETGALVWKAVKAPSTTGSVSTTEFGHTELKDSIPSDVAVVDSDGDSLADRIVVGDSGGNVWRADMPGTDRTAWSLQRLATLGRSGEGGADKINDRRFFHRPDIVFARDTGGKFDAIVLGNGDRADPLDKGGRVDNYMFMIKDRRTTPGTATTDPDLVKSDLGNVDDNCLQRNTCGASPPDLTNGWALKTATEDGEKSLATALTVGGEVFFTTYLPPDPNDTVNCGPGEGSGRLYAVNLQDATAVRNYNESDDISGDDSGDPNSASDRSYVLASSGIPAEVVFVPGDVGVGGLVLTPALTTERAGSRSRWRSYWRHEE